MFGSIKRKRHSTTNGSLSAKKTKLEPSNAVHKDAALCPVERGNSASTYEYDLTDPRSQADVAVKEKSTLKRHLSLRSTGSQGESSSRQSVEGFTRHNSLVRLRKPLMNLQGSVRVKLTQSVCRGMMRGRQDYSLGFSPSKANVTTDSRLDRKQDTEQSAVVDKLRNKIDLELKMRDGTAKLMAVCRGAVPSLDVAKNLLVSNTRLKAYMEDLENCSQSARRSCNDNEQQVEACKGSVTISDLRIPLMWKNSDHFSNKGDHHRCYAVFCLLRIGSNVQDTELLTDVSCLLTDISFNSVINFENVDADFDCCLEVYAHKMDHGTQSVASTPQKIRRKMTDLSLSIGRRLSGIKEENSVLSRGLIGPRFDCIARGTLKLNDVGGLVGSYDLLVSQDTPDAVCLPLFRHFSCHITAHPNCLSPSKQPHCLSGLMTIKNPKVAVGTRQYWCRIEPMKFVGWKLQEHADRVNPAFTIVLDTKTKLTETQLLSDNSASFEIIPSTGSKSFALIADDISTATKWRQCLQQLLADIASWRHACSRPVDSLSFNGFTSSNGSSTLRRSSRYITSSSITSSGCYGAQNDSSPLTRIMNRLHVDNLSPPDRKSLRSLHSVAVVDNSRRPSAEIRPQNLIGYTNV